MARRLRFGLWYDFRNPPQWRQEPAALYEGIFAQIARAEALGWDDVWLSEHHFIADGYTPSMLPLACAIAARTRRIQIGTSVLLLPLHDPLRVAEDAATVDVASNGRFQLGVAGGYRKGEFSGFGVRAGERAARMEEALPILRRLFAGETVSSAGRFHRYTDVCLTPLPVQRPLPIWMGGFSEPAVKRAARLADGFIATGPVAPLVEVWRRELERLGRDPARQELAAGITWLLVARDPERRWREAEAHFLYQINLYAQWFGEAGMSVAAPAASGAELQARGVAIVRPEQAAALIRDYCARVPVDRFYGWTLPPGLPPDWSDEHIELMAREVIPQFRS
ncbi:MAG TPA: LLM class flavin-dependent oxidoreductase [Myxococcota bacterium]|nr:LLM class flavin-dependent oxidoreductase [Myxococcota bacterium]